MGAGARKKMESPSRGPREEGAGAGARAKKEWEPGPREERGSKDTNTKRRGDKDDGEHDTVTMIPGMYMRGTATSEHLEKQRE